MPRKKKTKLRSAAQVAFTKPIVNQYGDAVQSAKPQASQMYDASLPTNRPRTQYYNYNDSYNQDFNNNVTETDWNTILSRARDLYANVGSVRNAICEITDMAVGDGWYPKYVGPDQKFGAVAEEWLANWMQIADVRGQPYDFHRDLKLACISTLRDGDALCILTTDASGKLPRTQWLPAHTVGSRGYRTVQAGMFKGYDCANGIIYNGQGAVIGYNILGSDRQGKEDQQVSVVDAQLVLDPEYFDQSRGISALASGITDFVQYKQIKGFELLGIKHASNFAVQMFVPPEEVDDVTGEHADSPYVTRQNVTGSRNISIETLQGGEVNVWRPDSGAKLEVLESHRPSAETAQFLLDHCLRNCFLSLRWPVEMCFDMNSRGATTKLVVAKAQRRIEDIQSHVIYPIWRRIISYTVAKAIKSGLIPKSDTWWMFEPTYPRSFVLENYRDVKADLDLYAKGITTATQMAAGYGYDYYKNLEQKAKELSKAEEIATKYNLNRNELVNQTIQGNAIAPPIEPEKKEGEQDEEDNKGKQDSNKSDKD